MFRPPSRRSRSLVLMISRILCVVDQVFFLSIVIESTSHLVDLDLSPVQ